MAESLPRAMQLHVTAVNSPLAFNKSFAASPLPDLWPGLWHGQIFRLYLCVTWPVRSLCAQGDVGSPWLANWGLRALRCSLAMAMQHISLCWRNRDLRHCHNNKKNNNNQAFPSVLLLPHGGHTWLTCVGQTAGWKPMARLPGSVAYLDQHKDVGAMALAVSVNTFPPRNHPPPQHETNKPPPCDDISYSVTFAWLHWMLPRLALCAMLMNSCNGWIRPQHPFFEEEPAPIWMAVLKHSTRSVSNSEMSVWYIDAWIHTVAHKVCSYLYV